MHPFFDRVSEDLYNQIPQTSQCLDKVLLHFERFDLGQSYVTARVQNRFGENVKINIQGGKEGIELQESLFRLQGRKAKFAFLIATMIQTKKILVRKVPIMGIMDWLLIYEDELFLQATRDSYDEHDIRLVE